MTMLDAAAWLTIAFQALVLTRIPAPTRLEKGERIGPGAAMIALTLVVASVVTALHSLGLIG